jgi:hypothetical protein
MKSERSPQLNENLRAPQPKEIRHAKTKFVHHLLIIHTPLKLGSIHIEGDIRLNCHNFFLLQPIREAILHPGTKASQDTPDPFFCDTA